MNKTEHQKELLAKIKPGTKPSDLKKTRAKPKPKQVLLPPIAEKDEGYGSDNSSKHTSLKPNKKPTSTIPPTVADSIPTPPPAPNIQLLTLKKQIELHKDIKKADERIKTEQKEKITQLEEKIRTLIKLASQEKAEHKQNIKDLQQKNQALNKTIQDLQNQNKNQEEVKPEPKTKEIGTQTESTYFYCDICQNNKHGNYIIRKVDSPFQPRTHKKTCYVCSACRKYTKEFAEITNWKEEDNPYKVN